jgi:hypothetical protein
VSQIAAIGALDATDELDGHVGRYRVNRDVLIDGLASAGINRRLVDFARDNTPGH